LNKSIIIIIIHKYRLILKIFYSNTKNNLKLMNLFIKYFKNILTFHKKLIKCQDSFYYIYQIQLKIIFIKFHLTIIKQL